MSRDSLEPATQRLTLDLSDVASVAEIHQALARVLGAYEGSSWDAFWNCITEQRRLPDVLVLEGLDELEKRLPREAERLLTLLGNYNNERNGHVCAAEVSDGYAGSLQFVSMEAKPGPDADTVAVGGFVCCWVKTDDPKAAERMARTEVEDAGWVVAQVEDVLERHLHDYPPGDPNRDYVKQACIDGVVVVFHSYEQEEDPDEDDYDGCEERRSKTVEVLRSMGVAINENLPYTEPESEVELRSATETARRTLCLLAVAGASHGVDRPTIRRWLIREDLWDACSPEEAAFLQDPEFDEEAATQLSWRSEALWLLVWAIGGIDDLVPPTTQTSPDEILGVVPGFDDATGRFVESATMRPIGDVMAMSDFLYCAHWALRNQELDPETAVGNLDRGVVMERHYAVNWLTGYGDADWDDVTCDT